MTHTIQIELHGYQWHCRFSDPTIQRLMGTDLVPTPYLGSTDRAQVVTMIAKSNPEYIVS